MAAVSPHGLQYDHTIIDLSNKPQEFLDKYSLAVNRGSFAKVPLLEHGDTLITESIEVTKYIGQTLAPELLGGDADPDRMYPLKDTKKRQLVDQFIDVWENEVTTSYYDCLTSTSEKSASVAQRRFTKALKTYVRPILLESREILLQESDGDEYSNDCEAFLLGRTFSVAECVAAPWVQRFHFVLHHFRGIDFRRDVLEECDDDGSPVLQQWMEAVLNRPSVQSTICPHKEMAAAAMRYYVSYVSPGAPASQ